MTTKTKGQQFANDFSNFVNIMNNDTDTNEAVQDMLYDHRTLQQSMMGFFMKFVEGMAKSENFDGRNEASVELAKSIMEIDESVRILPFV
jgi:hypothetical protein|tara:strand:- start:80 stop:349 length:270 start_codon:yes stop_codon:yes gene_type:complete